MWTINYHSSTPWAATGLTSHWYSDHFSLSIKNEANSPWKPHNFPISVNSGPGWSLGKYRQQNQVISVSKWCMQLATESPQYQNTIKYLHIARLSNCCKEQLNYVFDTEMSHYQPMGENCVCGVMFFIACAIFFPKLSFFTADSINFGWIISLRN